MKPREGTRGVVLVNIPASYWRRGRVSNPANRAAAGAFLESAYRVMTNQSSKRELAPKRPGGKPEQGYDNPANARGDPDPARHRGPRQVGPSDTRVQYCPSKCFR